MNTRRKVVVITKVSPIDLRAATQFSHSTGLTREQRPESDKGRDERIFLTKHISSLHTTPYIHTPYYPYFLGETFMCLPKFHYRRETLSLYNVCHQQILPNLTFGSLWRERTMKERKNGEVFRHTVYIYKDTLLQIDIHQHVCRGHST